jgi:hypothetical protein
MADTIVRVYEQDTRVIIEGAELLAPFATRAEAAAQIAESLVGVLGGVAAANYAELTGLRDTNVTDRWATSYNFTTMTMVASGATLGSGVSLAGISLPLQAGAGAVTVKVTLRRRALSSAAQSDLPGSGVDTVINTFTYPISTLPIAVGGALTELLLPFATAVTVEATKLYLVSIEMLDEDGDNVPVGFGHGALPAGTADYLRGWYKVGAGSWMPIGSGNAPAISWLRSETPDLSAITGRVYLGRDRVIKAQSSVNGYTVTISKGLLLREGITQGFQGAVTLDIPAGGFTRIDQIGLNPDTLALVVTKGSEVSTGDHRERQPAIPAGIMPLFSCIVGSGPYMGETVYTVPMWTLEDNSLRSDRETRAADFLRSRRALSKTLSRARQGLPITVAVMGDSIVAWSNNAATPPSNSTPNGTNRDVPGYLRNTGGTQYIQNDLINALPTFDHGDGAGSVHLHASKTRITADALGHWGSPITYLNFGLAGTHSGTGLSGIGGASSNGRHATLLNAVMASGAHVLFLAYDMNRLGSPDTLLDLVFIVQAAYAAGMDVLLWGCPRPNSASFSTVDWLYTCRAIRAAAEYTDPATGKSAGYVDTIRLYDDPALGIQGGPSFSLCTANQLNHPGIREHAREAREAVDMLVLS